MPERVRIAIPPIAGDALIAHYVAPKLPGYVPRSEKGIKALLPSSSTMKDASGQNPTPNNPTPLVIHYDEGGNPVFQDNTGRFIPYYGQFPVYPPGLPLPHPSAARGVDMPSMTASASHPPPVAGPADWILPPPLPDDSDEDLIDGPTVAKAQGHAPAKKVAGVRLKDKGKQKASASSSKGKQRSSAPESSRKRKVVDISSDDDNDDPDPKRGRPRGAGNYHSQD
ncbi:hypothetical protein H0H93_006667, partial [Arthromyces matolae]